MKLNARDYLSQVHYTEVKIRKMKIEIEECKRLSVSITGVNYDQLRVDCSRNNDAPFKKWVIRVIEMEKEVEELEQRLPSLKEEVVETINQIEEPDLKSILFYRYFDWMSWSKIAKKLFLSSTSTRRLHDKALEKLKF